MFSGGGCSGIDGGIAGILLIAVRVKPALRGIPRRRFFCSGKKVNQGGLSMFMKIAFLAFLRHFIILAFVFLILNSSFFIPNSEAGTIQLPQTGQTTCYDSGNPGAVIACGGTGQDGNLRAGAPWPNPRFTVTGECVTDNLTGLMWARDGNLPGGTRDWRGALAYVANLNSGGGLCGHSDWRLPNVNELESLVNAEQANSSVWLNGQGFTNVQAYAYWSSSTYALTGYTGTAWCVNMWFGGVSYAFKSGYYLSVWPVRAGN
jgi:hypothetical protein